MLVTVEYSLLLHAFKSVTAEGAMPVFGVALNFHFLVPNDKCQQEVPIFLFLCTDVIVLMLPFFFSGTGIFKLVIHYTAA